MNPALPWLPQGTVYGTLLNFRREFALWTARMHEPPYKAPPTQPVLYVKTANTFAPNGAAVPVPGEIEVGASVGLVRMHAPGTEPDRWAAVLLADLSLPHASYYRPPIKYRNRNGFLVCGPASKPLATLAELAALRLDERINNAVVQTVDLSTLVRDAATLLADVQAFMTLQAGDVLMLGTDCLADGTRPRARAGDRVEIRAAGFAPLVHTLVEEVSAAGPPQVARAPSGLRAAAPDSPVRVGTARRGDDSGGSAAGTASADTSVRSVGGHIS